VGNPLRWVLAIALASLGLYLLLALRYPLEPSLAFPRATWFSLAEESWSGFAIHISIYIGLYLLYAIVLWLLAYPYIYNTNLVTGQPNWNRWLNILIVISWLAFSIVLMTVAPAGESHDIFDYVFRGRMMAEFQANPLAEIPKLYKPAAYYRYLAWHSHVDTYGPLWEIASNGVATSVRHISRLLNWWGEDLPSCPSSPNSCHLLIAYLTVYRLFAIGLAGAAAGLIASMVRRYQPVLVSAALVAWLWNPLMLIATAVGGHNELLVIVLFLAGLWLMQRERPFLALMTLILAAHVKLTALIFIPIFALWIVRKWGWWRALGLSAGSLALGILVSWLLYLPFDGWGTLPRMLHERSLYLANSPWQVIYNFLYRQRGWPKEIVRDLAVDLPTILFIAGAVVLSLWMLNFRPKRWRRSQELVEDDDRQLWIALIAVSLLYLVVGAFWFQHWYVLWILAPAALVPGNVFSRTMLVWLSFGALSANLAQSYLITFVPETFSKTIVYLLTVIIIWAPMLIAGFVIVITQRRSRMENR
jgi:hypothetical protein